MEVKERVRSEICGVILLALTIFILLSLISYNPNDLPFNQYPPNFPVRNLMGRTGAYSAFGLFQAIGWFAYFVPFICLACGWRILRRRRIDKLQSRLWGVLLFLLASCTLLSLRYPEMLESIRAGGYSGFFCSKKLKESLEITGAYLVGVTALLISLPLVTHLSYPRLFYGLAHRIALLVGGTRRITRKSVSPTTKRKSRVSKEAIQSGLEGPYQLPPLSLLAMPSVSPRSREDLKTTSHLLEETLSDFDIRAKVVNITQGPVITRYEVQPAPGVTISSITSRANDIALKLAAPSVRIEAPIPGRAAVGIEIPNREPSYVHLVEVLDIPEFKQHTSSLTFGLGKDISGKSIIADLDLMPHLLIAGATGSGKSVCINALINSILFKAAPDEVQFLLVDPKRVELRVYNDIPHLIAPVITDPRQATLALKWLVEKTEERYRLFASAGARDIIGYNRLAKRMAYLVVVIDELADLMLVAPRDCENALARLAQTARGVGIHIVLATQRPSVDIITGLIKANFPTRIAFQVSSRVDSRVVLDISGAEKLLGSGDMLFAEAGSPKPIRIQGSLITESEIKRVTDFIKSQARPTYQEGIFEAEAAFSVGIEQEDELYKDAVRLVIASKYASVSMLQRRLRVGYSRAARLMDLMEEERIVGPPRGSKVREILVGPDYLQRLDKA